MTDYTDDTLVYVDPRKKAVIGVVEWEKDGQAKRIEMTDDPRPEEDEDGESNEKGKKGRPRRKPKKRYYPWCTYRTAKRVYRIEGKEREVENYKQLDEVMTLAEQEPFWS